MRRHPKWVIRHVGEGRRRRRLVLATSVAVGALALALAWFAGAWWGAPAAQSARARSATFERALSAQASANARLQTRVAFLEQSFALAKQSETATRKALFDQQAKEIQLRRKLAFYEGIVTGEAAGTAIKIAGLQIIPTNRAREYRFQIVLVHAGGERGKEISGTCSIVVSGLLAGKPRRYAFAELSVHAAGPMKFALRYFSNLAGTLTLPPDFTPKEVDISIAAGDAASVTSSYSWPVFRG